MNTESAFADLGVDAVTGSLIMDTLGLTPDDLRFPERFHKLHYVVDYLKRFPEDVQRYIVNKATRGKLVDKLDHMLEYTRLLQRKEAIEGSIKQSEVERSMISIESDPILVTDIAHRLETARHDLSYCMEEIHLFEK